MNQIDTEKLSITDRAISKCELGYKWTIMIKKSTKVLLN